MTAEASVTQRRVILTADDFGLSEGVNEAVERAHRQGLLSTASLMVAGPAAADAVRRARAMPDLRVGLHLVVVEGASVRPSAVKGLVDAAGDFSSDQVGAAIDYFFWPKQRKQLRSEIRSQFSAFAKTGLRLDHANAHKHMHLHPTVGRMLVQVGAQFGLKAVRVPQEPAAVLARAGTRVGLGGAIAGHVVSQVAGAGAAGGNGGQRSCVWDRLVGAYDGGAAGAVGAAFAAGAERDLFPPGSVPGWAAAGADARV